MKLILIWIVALLAVSCKEENITQVLGPEDWQGPIVEWHYQPEAELRGTVGVDVSTIDSSAISWVRLYLDGQAALELLTLPYRFEFNTDTLADGVHILEARAQDEHGNLGISPILRVNIMNSYAQGPRLIWVPDSFATIQAAINAADDFDTIRVRDGVYYESLNLFGKGIWLESENGPMQCNVDVTTGNNALYAPAGSYQATVRGFTFKNGSFTIYLVDGSNVRILNNIVMSDSAESLLLSNYGGGDIVNNLFSRSILSVLQLGYHWGTLHNNIVQFGQSYGLWNAALSHNPLEYGYNLLWQNINNYNDRFEPGEGDVYADPMINLEGGFLEVGSAAVDSGHPQILDVNGTRSDIGPFGGPYAYTNTEGQNHRKGTYHGKLGK